MSDQISKAEELNTKFREKQAYLDLKLQYDTEKAKSEEKTEIIEKCRAKKVTMIQEAEYPIDGLKMTDDGVEYNGIPLSQISSAEQLDVSVAMGFALNPRLPLMIIRDGALLDEDSLIKIATKSAEKGGQVFIERVGEGSECHVIMKDGEATGEQAGEPEEVEETEEAEVEETESVEE